MLMDEIINKQTRVEKTLARYIPTSPNRLHEAMRYSTLLGGKRIRPLLVYGAGLVFNAPLKVLDIFAASVEMMHCYSLIHDDLPAMDNDDMRRGKPSVHKQFDEATAILAGDALQSLAFLLLATEPKNYEYPEKRILCIQTLATACGAEGMALGQMLDMSLTSETATISDVIHLQQLKTGRLLQASVQLGILAGQNRQPEQVRALHRFGECIGSAFQIKDDLLDIESTTSVLGKPQFSDIQKNKPTYPSTASVSGAHEILEELIREADDALKILGERGDFLRNLARFVLERNY